MEKPMSRGFKSVLMVGTLPPIKGISPYCKDLVKSLSKLVKVNFIGFRSLYPEIFYPGGTKSNGLDEKCDFDNVHKWEIIDYYNPVSWVNAGLKGDSKVLHVQWWAQPLAPIFFTILLIARVRDRKTLITVHNVEPHEKNRLSAFINKVVFSLGDEFIVHNERSKKCISQSFNIDMNRIHVVPHGILKLETSQTLSKMDAREVLKINSNDKVLLFFGNIRDYKGLDVLLEAMSFLLEKMEGLKLIIAGNPWVKWGKYEEIIEKKGLTDRIIKNLGFIEPEEVNVFFSASDLVVLPYKYFEAQSGVGTLAISYGKPMLVTDVGGLPDLVMNERAIALPNDAEDLALKIANILQDEQLYNDLEEKSVKLASEYDWGTIASKTVHIYESLLKLP